TERDIVAGSLFRTKSIDRLMDDVAGSGQATLKRTLGPMSLVALGIGAIIRAGLFVRTAVAIAERAGPSVTLAFIVAGIGGAFAGLCYAEFASMIPDRKITRLNSSHVSISYAVFCLKKKTIITYASGL